MNKLLDKIRNKKISHKITFMVTLQNTMWSIISIIILVGISMIRKQYFALVDTSVLTAEQLAKYEHANSSVASANFVFLIGFVITITVSTLLAIVLSHSIKKPVWQMRDAAVKMAEGDMDVEITHIYDDEVGELADAMIKVRDAVKEHANVAKSVSEGDMTVEIIPHGENDLMGNSLANMLKEENRVMSNIRSSVMELRIGSEQVASASQSLAQGSTEQASAIEEVTASINDIAESTKGNAKEAATAHSLVAEAKHDAETGTSKMAEMIDAMAEINVSSENIGKIIKVIDDIAFQTNILALNAAVEAARAGQHGKGFAVVADEVRNLAGKSAQAASETAELIEDTIKKVSNGSRLAEETSSALSEIDKAIDKIVTITNSIQETSNAQAVAVEQIDIAINQVSMVVQTNSATSEECAAASEELSAQAGKLKQMIARYQLKKAEFESYSAPEPAESYGGFDDDDDDERDDEVPVISLDDNFGKY